MYRDALIRNTYQAMVLHDGEVSTLTADHPAYHDVSHDEIVARRSRDQQQQKQQGPTEGPAASAQQQKKGPYRPPKGGLSLEPLLHRPQHQGDDDAGSSTCHSAKNPKSVNKFQTTFTASNNVLSTPTKQHFSGGFPQSNRSMLTMTPMSGMGTSDARRPSSATPHSFDDNFSLQTSLTYTFALPPTTYDEDEDTNSWLNDDDMTVSSQYDDLIAEAVMRNLERSKKGGSRDVPFNVAIASRNTNNSASATAKPAVRGGGFAGPSRGGGGGRGQQRQQKGGRRGGGGSAAPGSPTGLSGGRFDALVRR